MGNTVCHPYRVVRWQPTRCARRRVQVLGTLNEDHDGAASSAQHQTAVGVSSPPGMRRPGEPLERPTAPTSPRLHRPLKAATPPDAQRSQPGALELLPTTTTVGASGSRATTPRSRRQAGAGPGCTRPWSSCRRLGAFQPHDFTPRPPAPTGRSGRLAHDQAPYRNDVDFAHGSMLRLPTLQCVKPQVERGLYSWVEVRWQPEALKSLTGQVPLQPPRRNPRRYTKDCPASTADQTSLLTLDPSSKSDVAIATNSPMSGLRRELSQAKQTWLGAMSSMPIWVMSLLV